MMKRKHIRNYLIAAALVLLAAAALAWGWGAPSLLPFEAEEVSEIEMYQYIVPAATQKKTVSDPDQIEWVCNRLSVWAFPWPFEPTSYVGGGAASFRFHLSDGTEYALIYTPPRSIYRTDAGRRWTLTDLEQVWYDCDAPAVPAPQSELPVIQR